jgi:hypothetical protein
MSVLYSLLWLYTGNSSLDHYRVVGPFHINCQCFTIEKGN